MSEANHKNGTRLSDPIQQRIDRLREVDRPRYRRLWAYYRNPLSVCGACGQGGSERPYRQAQEWGLPARITGVKAGSETLSAAALEGVQRKEVVVENDIGWRIDTMVDYLFGKPLAVRSTAPDEGRRAVIDRLIDAVLEHNGGILFLQQLALLGAVYGYVDVLVKLHPEGVAQDHGKALTEYTPAIDEPAADGAGPSQGLAPDSGSLPPQTGTAPRPAGELDVSSAAPTDADSPADDPGEPGASNTTSHDGSIERIARRIRLEIVEPARSLPFFDPTDAQAVQTYGQCYQLPRPVDQPRARARAARAISWLHRLQRSTLRLLSSGDAGAGDPAAWAAAPAGGEVTVLELISADRWQRFEDGRLVVEGANSLGLIPLVHIQNNAVPFEYAGASDVESLIPLQDELNIRLSDRANRITLQSFKMYLGKGIDAFGDTPVAPGRMWATENADASVQEFGGDSACPSESEHVAEIREALDKSSGVTAIAAGVIKNRIGRLTSAAALRITLMALLARTDKKRTTYGRGLCRMIELSLAWLDRAGLFRTAPAERHVELHWPSPLPENLSERLQEAQMKSSLGVPRDTILRELGY